MADKYKWGVITTLADEHRLFHEERAMDEGVRIAIADNSGRTPEDTDDGILWLDFEWNLIISSPDAVLCIPVKRDSDSERFSTITNMSTMLYLSSEFGWQIEDQISGTLYGVAVEDK